MNPVTVRNLLISFALLLGVGLLLWATSSKSYISHDEGISYLAASANQGQFEFVNSEPQTPVTTWVSASDWKQFFKPEKSFAFRLIGTDLAQTDIHPPLYFWLLHLWVILFGTHSWTGPLLNIIFYFIGGLALFGLARSTLANPVEQGVVVFVWALSPAVIGLTLIARQYALLGTITILFVWTIYRWSAETSMPSWRLWLLLFLVTTAALLTHYHFVIYAAAAFLVFFVPLFRKNNKSVLFALLAMICGGFLFLFLHPDFYLSFLSLAQRQSSEATQLVSTINVLSRLFAIGATFTEFWVFGGIFQVLLFCVAVALIVWGGYFWLRNPAKFKAKWQEIDKTGFSILWFLLIVVGLTIGLYLTFLTPGNGMAARHLSAIWPFYAFLPVFLARFLQVNYRRPFMLIVCLIISVSSLVSTYQLVQNNNAITETMVHLKQAPMILSDSTHRGIFPRLFVYLPDDMSLFAGNQQQLIAASDNWLAEVEDGTIYISNSYYDNSTAGREMILSLLSDQFTVEIISGHWLVGQQVYIIKNKE